MSRRAGCRWGRDIRVSGHFLWIKEYTFELSANLHRTNALVRGSLTVNSRLHVKGDLDVRGKVIVGESGELVVDGKRTIHGSFRKLET